MLYGQTPRPRPPAPATRQHHPLSSRPGRTATRPHPSSKSPSAFRARPWPTHRGPPSRWTRVSTPTRRRSTPHGPATTPASSLGQQHTRRSPRAVSPKMTTTVCPHRPFIDDFRPAHEALLDAFCAGREHLFEGFSLGSGSIWDLASSSVSHLLEVADNAETGCTVVVVGGVTSSRKTRGPCGLHRRRYRRRLLDL